MVLFLIFSSAIFVLSSKLKNISSLTNKVKVTAIENKIDNAKMAGTCLKAMMDSIPADFCWKKPLDFGTIPTNCPKGYFRSLALCYEECKPGYKHVLGVCWASCSAGYNDIGLVCTKGISDWFFKKSYIPKSLTNFSDQIKCNADNYKLGALCYRDCKTLDMVNCGIGACAVSAESCGAQLVSMSIDVVSSLTDFAMLVATFGGYSQVKTTVGGGKQMIVNALKKLGKSFFKSSLSRLKSKFAPKLRQNLFSRAKKSLVKTKEWTKEFTKELYKGYWTEMTISKMCENIWSVAVDQTLATQEVNENSLIGIFDVFGVKDTYTSCSNNESLDCAKGIVGAISVFDPTGILTLGSVFAHPFCEFPEKEAVPEPPVEITQAYKFYEKNQDSCIQVFTECNFKGKTTTICNSQTLDSDFNDNIRSMIPGAKAKGLIFEHAGFDGLSFPFSPGMNIPCFDKINIGELNFRDVVSSILFNGDDCLAVRSVSNSNWNPKKHVYWNNILFCLFDDESYRKNTKIVFDISQKRKFYVETLNPKMKVIVYAGTNYTGTSYEFNSNIVGDPIGNAKYPNRFNVIKSYKIIIDP